MHHHTRSGFTTTAVIGAVVTVAVLAALGWYAMRQGTSVPETTETPIKQLGEEDITTSPVIQSHRSFTLKSDASGKSYQPKQPTTYTFSIVDDQGTTLKSNNFATVHEKIMHVIIVRKDLQEFQHVHPDFNQTTGQFTLANLTFPSDGPYRIFADFTPTTSQIGADGQLLPVTLNEDVTVGTLANYKAQPVVDSPLSKTFQNYQVQITATPTPITAGQPTTLTFAINQSGKPVTNLEKYLGALGHSVVLREGDLEFLHTHALDENVTNQTGKVDFAVTFPSAAKYKVFSQFQHQGKILTTNFVLSAQSAAAGTNQESPQAAPLHNAPTH